MSCSFLVLYTWNAFPIGTVINVSFPNYNHRIEKCIPSWFKQILFLPHTKPIVL